MLVLANFAKDELLLAAAVSVSLGTVGYVAAPWQGLGFGGASATDEAVALYRQIEDANQAYFDKYGLWPHEVTQNTPYANVAALMSRAPLVRPFAQDRMYQPVMDGLLDTANDGLHAKHTLGAGGAVGQIALNGSDYRYVVTFENLSMDDAKALDAEIDGEFGPAKGRLRVVQAEDGTMTAKYLANERKATLARR